MIIQSKDEIRLDPIDVLIMTSIGGSPIHRGHLSIINNCKQEVMNRINKKWGGCCGLMLSCAKLLVIVNSDDFLIRKHGFAFQDEKTRAELIDNLKAVDYTYIHHSHDQTVTQALVKFQPKYFCKGGDRSSIDSLPRDEVETCKNLGCEIVFGVGGSEKMDSSSDIIKKAVDFYVRQKT